MMIVKHYDENGLEYIVVDEARRFEMIATELFEAGSPWLSFADVEADADHISGTFTIRAINGKWTYRLTSWCSWMPQVANAELIDGPVLHCDAVTVAGLFPTNCP